MILRVKDVQSNLQLVPRRIPIRREPKKWRYSSGRRLLKQLSANPPLGRIAIRISPDINSWKNTAADVDVRAGDALVVPKKPSYVMVTGQVYNATAVAYRPGKSAEWYLKQSGGPTQLANKKAIFVIRADGSVLGSSSGMWSGESAECHASAGGHRGGSGKGNRRGHTVADGFLAAQVASSIASTAFIAAHY